MDYIRALGEAYEAEQGPAAKDAIAQILTNSRMCAEGHRPICQDTGIVNVFVKWGQDCRLESDAARCRRSSMRACAAPINHPENKLRASILADPAFTRRNTKDNTPVRAERRDGARAARSRSTSRPRAAAARTSPSSR